MKKIIAISTVVATMFVGVGSANACNDMSNLRSMTKVSKQMQSALTSGQQLNFAAALNKVNRAKAMFHRAPKPCAAKIRLMNTYYGKALLAYENAMFLALGGEYTYAAIYMKQGNNWVNRASAALS